MLIRKEIKNLTEKAIKKLYKIEVKVKIDRPQDAGFGDYSTNVAMLVKKNPQEIAKAIKSPIFEKIEVKNGFINFFVSKDYLQDQLKNILKESKNYGKVHPVKSAKGGAKKFNRVNVEFISANPTGPLTLGNGRGGFCGDVLANILQSAGYKAIREYYINDAGEQVRKLGHSVLGDEQAVYKGKYIEELRIKLKPSFAKASADAKALADKSAGEIGKKAAKIILKDMIKPSVEKMGIKFNVWFSEESLYKGKKSQVDAAIEFLKKKQLTYEKEGALWFLSTKFGDDKDRVLIKANGGKTYLASDIAYLRDKIKRGFKILFIFLGADHFGYIGRIKAAAQAFGFEKDNVNLMIMQLVRLMQNGQEVKMSKRAGTYVTLDELIDEVGLDVARFFFLSRAANSHLNFDLDLAKEHSEKNPVYYIQYAYARICSIIAKLEGRKWKVKKSKTTLYPLSSTLKSLTHESELALIKQLIRLPEIIEDTAKDYQMQRLPQYATDLATSFHAFYRDCKVLSEVEGPREDRLALVLATKIVLENTLKLMGISAPEKM